MKCHHNLASLVAVALLGTITPAPAEERPFRLRGAGEVLLDETLAGPFTASGQATHLGRWTNQGTIQFTPIPGTPLLTATGEVTFTAANGDTLTADIEGILDVSAVPFVGNATFYWTGGTGRFENASGRADFVALNDPDGSFTFTCEGSIDY
jgi:hypothetical protein